MADITQDFRFRSSTVRENWTLPIAMSQVRQGFELRLSRAIEILVPFRFCRHLWVQQMSIPTGLGRCVSNTTFYRRSLRRVHVPRQLLSANLAIINSIDLILILA